MTQARSTSPKPLVSVYAEKGVLAFRFSSKYNPLFEILDGKAPTKQRTMGLGLRESPENWKLAQSAALRIERDLSDSENWQILFDPTFVKYGLAVKYTSAALKLAAPIPEAEPEMTVGAMWEDYLVWKQPQLEPTTYRVSFLGVYTNALKGLVWSKKTQTATDSKNGVWDLPLCSDVTDLIKAHPLCATSKKKLFSALSEAFARLQSQGKTKLTKNPFVLDNKVENKTDKYKSTVDADGTIRLWHELEDAETNPDERDRRAFTKDERDIIIKAFYESDRPAIRAAAPLVEFLFLTGCRSGEAFALTWNNIKFDNNQIVIHKSYAGSIKQVKSTKNSDIRLFLMYPKLRELLLRIKPDNAQPTSLVFPLMNGNSFNSNSLGEIWNGGSSTKKGRNKYYSIGIVTQLVTDGLISCYLSPHHARHTFISLQAHAGTDLVMLSGICSVSVDTIMKHYLEHDKEAQPLDI